LYSEHPELLNPEIDDAERKKLMQKIRNRQSAQESRDRKKTEYTDVLHENTSLKRENETLKEKIQEIEAKYMEIQEKYQKLLEKGSEKDSVNLTETNDNSEVVSGLPRRTIMSSGSSREPRAGEAASKLGSETSPQS
jgi:predicted nuclease with TOPRIM domain